MFMGMTAAYVIARSINGSVSQMMNMGKCCVRREVKELNDFVDLGLLWLISYTAIGAESPYQALTYNGFHGACDKKWLNAHIE
jgi:hypothetical protein